MAGIRRTVTKEVINEVVPEVKPTPTNLSTIPHSPGAISQQKVAEARENTKPVEDIITARVVGTKFRSGEAIVRDGGGNNYTVRVGQSALTNNLRRSGGGSTASLVVGQSVIIGRSRSQTGERTVRLLSIIPLGRNPQDALASLNDQSLVNALCEPTGNATIISGGRQPEEPESPEDQEEPAPPTEPNPNEPDSPDDPPSKPFGCSPDDSAQWYNGSSCPAGLRSLGFAILPSGETMTLCTGDPLPPGDGCPEVPDEFGWECIRVDAGDGTQSESCQEVPNGLYATKGECEEACLCDDCNEEPEVPLPSYDEEDGVCVPSVGGAFGSLEDCERDSGLGFFRYGFVVAQNFQEHETFPFGASGTVFCSGIGSVNFRGVRWADVSLSSPNFFLIGPISLSLNASLGQFQVSGFNMINPSSPQTIDTGIPSETPIPYESPITLCFDGASCTSAEVCADGGSGLGQPRRRDYDTRITITSIDPV